MTNLIHKFIYVAATENFGNDIIKKIQDKLSGSDFIIETEYKKYTNYFSIRIFICSKKADIEKEKIELIDFLLLD